MLQDNQSELLKPSDHGFMERAHTLARRALGKTRPNPVVGAVVVRNGTVVGEGYHASAGEAHAEVVALAQAGDAAAGATLYVTLEPCNHTGKTPPCTKAIMEAGIARVIFALADPAPHGGGRGLDALEKAGIQVEEGLGAAVTEHDNRFFLHSVTSNKPWVVAKYAMSLDGKIATHSGDSQWITGEQARSRSHELRGLVDGVLVGSGTVLSDDPALDVRLEGFDGLQPRRIMLDGRGRAPINSKLFSDNRAHETVVITTADAPVSWKRSLTAAGVDVIECGRNKNGRIEISEMLDALNRLGLQSLMVEGGASVLGSFFDAGLVNEVWAFIAPRLIGGLDAPCAVAGDGVSKLTDTADLSDVRIEALGDDVLIRGVIRGAKVNGVKNNPRER